MKNNEDDEPAVSPEELARRAKVKAAQIVAGDRLVRDLAERHLDSALVSFRSLVSSPETDEVIGKLVEARRALTRGR
jgi:hypothetical protein